MRVIANAPDIEDVFVVMQDSIEYNDETYYTQGEELGSWHFYTTVEEAQERAQTELRLLLYEFQICDIEQYYWPHLGAELVREYVLGRNGGADHFDWWGCEVPISDFIQWCEEQGHEWPNLVPQFVRIARLAHE